MPIGNENGAEQVAERVPLGDLFRRLPGELQAVVTAEIGVVRADAARRAISAGWALGLGLLALILLSSALIAGLVGAIIWIGQSLGTGGAILIVVGACLAIAVVAALLALGRAKLVANPDAKR